MRMPQIVAFPRMKMGWPVARPLVSFFPENSESRKSIAKLTFLSKPVLSPPRCRHRHCHCHRLLKTKKQEVGNDCLMTVDNTDFRVPQKGVTKRGNTFTSRKYTGKSALRYELGVNILTGNLGVDPGSLPCW